MGKEEILLKEYEACQSEINSIGSMYWIIVGVFMAINTALLGALPYAILQSGGLSTIFKDYATRSELLELLTLGLVIVVLGVGMITVLVFLKSYHKRTRHTVWVSHERMLHIEEELGMWLGWIFYGLDRMHKKDKRKEDYDFSKKINKKTRDRFLTYRPLEWWQSMRSAREYSEPEGYRSVKRIFCTFIAMWGVIVVAALVAVIRAIALLV